MSLGRGFESLIPTELIDEEFDPTASEDEKMSKLQEVSLEDVARDEDQPRKEFRAEAIESLAASIREHGILQPLVVTRENGKYKIVAGERRYRAAKVAGLSKVPVIVRTIDAQNRLELSIIENAQREDLNAIELATAYAKLKTQFNLSVKEIAERVGKSEPAVVNTMRLLNLPDDAKKIMVEKNLSEGVMRPLVAADKGMIEKILPKIIEEEWTARKVEKFIAENKKKSSARVIKENFYVHEEEKIGTKYGVKAKIRGKSLTLTCKNEEELKKIIERLS